MALRHLILHNFWAKLLSLVFAALLWMTLSFGKREDWGGNNFWVPASNATLILDRPIQVLQGTSDNRSFKLDKSTASVTIKGAAAALKRLNPQEVVAFVEVGPAELGESLTRPVRVYVPRSVGRVEIQTEPAEVTIEVH